MNRSRPIPFLATAAAILLIAVGVASCGGSSGSSSNASAANTPATAPANPAPTPVAKPAKQAAPAPAAQLQRHRRQLPPTASPRVTWATTIPTTTAAPMTATEASRGRGQDEWRPRPAGRRAFPNTLIRNDGTEFRAEGYGAGSKFA